MKHIHYSLVFLFVVLSQPLWSQVALRVQLQDSTKQPLGGAALLVRDSAHVYSAISDSSGMALLSLPHAGKYALHISLLGYQPIDTVLPIFSGGSFIPFVLHASPHALSEVVVRTENIAIQQQGEKFILHFVNPNFVQGRSIWDVLKTSPLIQVDENDQLSVLGNGNVIIFINGKRQYISMQALVQMLKGRPADDIQQLEIIPVPTAEYNAPTGSAIINIVFKKSSNYTKGYVNSTTVYRNLFTQMLAAGITHQKGTWSYDINLDGSYNQAQIRQTSTFTDPQLPLEWASTQNTKISYPNLDGSIQLTYQPGKNSELSLFHESYYASANPDHYTQQTFTHYLQTMNNGQDSSDQSFINNKLNYYEANSVLQYSWTQPAQQKKLEFILSHVYVSYAQSHQYAFENYQSSQLKSSTNLYQDMPAFNNNIAARISYTQPVSQKVILSAGAEYTHSYAHNRVNWSQFMGGQYVSIDSLNILYQLPEDVFEGFFNVRMLLSQKFMLNAGLRASHTHDDGKLNGTSVYRRDYNNFIPILQFTYQLSANHQFSYALEDGVYRPTFWDLVPFFKYSSSNVVDQNASSLDKVTYFKNYLTYTLRQKHVFMLYNNFQYHVVSQNGYPYLNPDGKLVFASTNLKYDDLASISYNSSYAFFKGIWNWNPYIYITYHVIRGKDSTAFLDNHRFWTGLLFTNQLVLSRKKAWFAQVYTGFTSPIIGDASFYKQLHAQLQLNISLMKRIKNWTFLLMANDLLNTNQFQTRRYIFQNPMIDYRVQQYYLMPQFAVRISWNFGNQKVSAGEVNQQTIQEIKRRAGVNL
ncbi:outer membrane beta-barrel protein [Thermoflavifilum thermophilum]|uniref:Outer membrane receptor proteins, mostly Fe transport n=1 Tax=Thermoflavifilum thermophilum TaxID=1393122 RepID=A0A1I7NM52_9BACT|nr:outer membrane beta-barrel protein [Thermoflavifilum thermophilum]SFV35716.1 Outer membrane receptor proteins, mostly Fe transport [Thermoflavifilum thermophilum]